MINEPENELGPHIEDLKRVLGDTVSESELKDKLMEYMKFADAGVTIFEAKKAIVKKFGGRSQDLAVGENKNLESVNARDSSVNLKVKVISINDKTVNVKGQPKEIHYGLFADTTITRPFTAWEDYQIAKGDILQIKSAYAKDFRVDGVISQIIRYCVPYAHDLPLLTERLKEQGIPTLALDVEYGTPGSGQIQTRVQAFLEMLETRKK